MCVFIDFSIQLLQLSDAFYKTPFLSHIIIMQHFCMTVTECGIC